MARQSGTSTAAQAAVRSWFDTDGWRLEPVELRRELEQRPGVDPDDIIELIDEGAERRAADTSRASLIYQPAEYVLGALLLAGAMGAEPTGTVLARVQEAGLEARMFDRERDRAIFEAVCAIAGRGEPAEWLIVEGELRRTGRFEQAGGRAYLTALANLAPATSNAGVYAGTLVQEAYRRDLERVGLSVVEAARNGGVTPDLANQLAALANRPATLGPPVELIHGGDFIFNEPLSLDEIRIWGHGEAIGWAGGEGLMVVGPDGVGKTTLCQQVALARAGLRTHALGLPVAADPHRVLYIAADRPRQAARSLRRMVLESERDQLNDRLHVWRGPLPAALNEDRTILTRLAAQFGCGSIIIDSLKDVAFDLASDDAAGRIASSFQHAIAAGVELLVLHHPRKPGVESNRKPRALADVYGNRLIFGVFGSVIMLWGEPGDAYIDLEHLKQPMDPVGPWKLRHDHARGFTEIEHGTDLLDVVLRTGTQGVTVKQAAGLVYETPDPTKNHVERIRQRLDKLTLSGQLVKHPAIGRDEPARYLYNGPAAAQLLAPAPKEELF